MEELQIFAQTDSDLEMPMPAVSSMAVASLVFAVLGPFSAGAVWVLSFSDFLNIGPPIIVAPFSCGLAWILGLILGINALQRIDDSDGHLLGREYAFAAVILSAAWMLLSLTGFLLPALYYFNS